MSGQIMAQREALEKTLSSLEEFKSQVLCQTDSMSSKAASGSSTMRDEKAKQASAKIISACDEIRSCLDIIESAQERVRQMIKDIDIALSKEM